MSKLKIETVKDLIPIFGQKIEQDNVQTVNARDVWEFLEVKKDFSNWIKDKIKSYDFIEGVDFVRSPNLASKTGSGGHNIKEYYISLDMAALVKWIEIRGKDPGALFCNFHPSGQRTRLTGDGLYKLIRSLGERAGIRTRPHGLRHAAITQALDVTRGDLRAAA
jgi:phage anti-repressor protein